MVPVHSNGADIPPAVCIREMSFFPAGQGWALGATVPVRAELLVESLSKVTSSHSMLDCCLDGVFQDGSLPPGCCSDILRGCDPCEQYRQSHLPLAWSSALLRETGEELRIRTENLYL